MDDLQLNTPEPNSTTAPKRRVRFERDKREFTQDFQLTPRDLEILLHVYRARLLTSDQIRALLSDPNHPSISAGQHIVRRLRRLYDRGLLDRPQSQQYFSQNLGSFTGGSSFVYALGRDGARVLADELGEPELARLNWGKKNREATPLFVAHELMISGVYTAVQLFLRSTPNLSFGVWQQGEAIHDAFYRDRDGNHMSKPSEHDLKAHHVDRVAIAPDALFSLRRRDSDSQLSFLLEADRSSETLKVFQEKVRRYLLWMRFGLHTKRFNLKHLVVLTVTRTEERMENLSRAVATVVSHDTADLFRFTCEKLYDKDPVNFRRKIWHLPHSQNRVSIFQ